MPSTPAASEPVSAEAPRYRIVGTAGHIDHGKSALVRALTDIDPDRLQEEKERGITIDLGFAHLDLDDGVRVGFIDVPGHERFVKNMLAGVGGIDAVLLVVAADESVMPQTREHFAICRLLGISAGVVALTKCDLVDEEIVDLVELEVADLVAGTFLDGAPVVRTSVVTGAGLDELVAALQDAVSATAGRAALGPARLPVDRVFTVRGFGTVVTGTLLSGSVQAGDALCLYPAERPVTVRGIQVHDADVEAAYAGQRTALNLQGIDVDQLERGDLLATPGTHLPTYLLDARLHVLPTSRPVENLDRVRFHHGAAEVMARVATLEGDAVSAGTSGWVQLRLESQVVTAPGDRFILRRYSPMTTIAGGTIVDPLPDKHRQGDAEVLRTLERLGDADDATRTAIWAGEAGLSGIGRDELAARLGRTPAEAEQAVERARDAGDIEVVHPGELRVVPRRELERLGALICEHLERFHAGNPLLPAAPKEEVRAATAPRAPQETFDRAVADLERSGRLRAGRDGLALAGHSVELEPAEERACDALEEAFHDAGLQPPDVDEILERLDVAAAGRELVHHLLRQGTLVRLREGHLFHAAVLQELVDTVRRRYEAGERFSVADFKELTGVTRKYAIPLLEHLDQLRVTRRVGDGRERL